MSSIASRELSPPAEAFRLQARLISLRPGLHLIRYISAKEAQTPPVVLVQPMPEDFAAVTLLSSRDAGGFSLDVPGDVLVVKAMREVKLVTTTASLGLGTEGAVLRIERIAGRDEPAPGSATARVELLPSAPPSRRLAQA